MKFKLLKIYNLFTSLGLVVCMLAMFLGPFTPVAHAAALTALSDTMTSSKISSTSSHTIKFTTPTGASDATDTIILTFPADFDFTSGAIADVVFTHGATTGAESTETLAASPSATAWGAVFSSTQNRVFTLTAPTDGVGSASLAASDKVIITYNSTTKFKNATSATSYTIPISGTFGDTGNLFVTLLSNDQVAVTATVAESLTFTVSDNTIEFGSLTAADDFFADDSGGNATEVEAHTLVVGTNAVSGYTTTVNGATLTSGANTISAIGSSNTSSSAGTEQFGLRMTASGGSGTVSAPYSAAGFAFDTAAFPDAVATSSTSSTNTTYSVRYVANITSATEPGTYSATLTYVTTANF